MINISLALKKDIKEKRELINMSMDRYLPRKDDFPKEIHKAMRHSLFAGGKRLRPYLVILSYLLLYKKPLRVDAIAKMSSVPGGQTASNDYFEEVLKVATATEVLHTYTLIHDDLPEIDNDDFRRGKKTCHILFGSDVALLAGDALIIEAFYLLNNLDVPSEKRIQMIKDMATLCGDKGLIAGQMQDILCEGKQCSQATLEFIHLNKTAKLIQLCTRFGAIMADAAEEDIKRMEEFGLKLGLAFQIIDDILDVEGSSKTLGKTVGKDASEKKATYPAVLGLEESKELADQLTAEAMEILSHYGKKATILKELTAYLLHRDK